MQDNQTDPSQVDQVSTQPSGYLVRHNDKIVGIFDNQFDATDAMNGYQMQNDVQLNDNLDIIQLL